MSHHHHAQDTTAIPQGHGHDYAAANIEHYTARTADFENPEWAELARTAVAAFRRRYSFHKETTVMDFACGVGTTFFLLHIEMEISSDTAILGLISRELTPYVKSIVGVDITPALVNIYNDYVSTMNIAPEEMRAVCVELKGEEAELDGLKFDVIVCSASYHHFGSIQDITNMLAFFLKPGGVLLVVDTLSAFPPAIAEEYRDVVPHAHGFTEEQIKATFESTGLRTFTFEPFTKIKIHGQDIALFLASAEKPAAASL